MPRARGGARGRAGRSPVATARIVATATAPPPPSRATTTHSATANIVAVAAPATDVAARRVAAHAALPTDSLPAYRPVPSRAHLVATAPMFGAMASATDHPAALVGAAVGVRTIVAVACIRTAPRMRLVHVVSLGAAVGVRTIVAVVAFDRTSRVAA